MSFNINYWSQMAYGGSGANTIWYYLDRTDNIASLAMGTVNTTYFGIAYSTHGIKAKLGDIIFAAYVTAANVGTSIMLTVPADWDANGSSVVATHH
jgi:hypothetical protein